MYNSHFPPLPPPPLHNAKQAIVTTQSESDEDLELVEYSDKETQEPVHEWQSVDKTKKRELHQKNDDKTKQNSITTSNRFEALSPQNGSNSNEQTQPNTQLTPKPPPIYIHMVSSITRRWLTIYLISQKKKPTNAKYWKMTQSRLTPKTQIHTENSFGI